MAKLHISLQRVSPLLLEPFPCPDAPMRDPSSVYEMEHGGYPQFSGVVREEVDVIIFDGTMMKYRLKQKRSYGVY
ncbi:hypothetical protein H5410_011479 [Solanum commersonii]|uniref:Uncharacterized protein n=1 Tax=Solanum commersonii TaxID=4109 RepID=A0A9J6ANR5_SOLCO|nr:hypothetical protein H5410_011479 [Solanum commersonii]